MANETLDHHLAAHGDTGGDAAAVAATVRSLAQAAVELGDIIELGALGAMFAGTSRRANAGGDEQKELDVLADEIFLAAASKGNVAVYASEELDEPVRLRPEAPLALALDPLDGSSNIDTNLSIGTIFSILPAISGRHADPLASFLQPGRAQLAAGFFIYGPQLILVLTLGAGTDIFVHSPRQQGFLRTYGKVAVRPRSQEFAINAANYRHWDDAVRHYVDDCLRGTEGAHGRDFNMRWLGSMVADDYRILIRGGVYLYPADSRKDYARGRLRLVYEANPIAMIFEQAGGLATDTVNAILDLVPQDLHEHTPLVFGSSSEVEHIRHYHDDSNGVGIRSPLFGQRGLFRT